MVGGDCDRTGDDNGSEDGWSLVATPDAEQVLDPASGERAYLAVTGATEESNNSVNSTLVFGTTDGGRTWTESVPLRAVSTASICTVIPAQHEEAMLGIGEAHQPAGAISRCRSRRRPVQIMRAPSTARSSSAVSAS